MLAAALFLALSARAHASTVPVRGVILISLDTVRADRLAKMPELARWAEGGVVFDRAYSEATWTLPAHASMLTGLYPSSHGAGGRPEKPRGLAASVPRLPGLLRAAGFATAGFYDGAILRPEFGLAGGFDAYERARFDGKVDGEFDQARAWLADHGRGKFFLFVHSFEAHRYLLAKSGLETCEPVYDFEHQPHFDKPDPARCEPMKLKYDQSAACLDAHLGRFLRWLDESGLAKTTLVIVTSDHGEALCDGQLRSPPLGHALPPYEDLARVVLAVRWPDGSFAGRREQRLIQHVDLAPLILEEAGLKIPARLDGRSPLAALRGEAPWPRSDVFLEDDLWQAVRTPDDKLISYADGARELYDVSADTAELRELSAIRPKRAAELASLLERFNARRGRRRGPSAKVTRDVREALRSEGYLP